MTSLNFSFYAWPINLNLTAALLQHHSILPLSLSTVSFVLNFSIPGSSPLSLYFLHHWFVYLYVITSINPIMSAKAMSCTQHSYPTCQILHCVRFAPIDNGVHFSTLSPTLGHLSNCSLYTRNVGGGVFITVIRISGWRRLCRRPRRWVKAGNSQTSTEPDGMCSKIGAGVM